eukprot:9663690-Alexandrium_andersonii.AAC.1
MACPGPRPAGIRLVAVEPGAPGFYDAPHRAAGRRNLGAPPVCAHTSNIHSGAPRRGAGMAATVITCLLYTSDAADDM